MKHLSYIFILMMFALGNAQTGLYNQGNLGIHQEGKIGFHTHLINDGVIDDAEGLAGFYSAANIIEVSGAFPATFYDTEFMTQNGVLLNTTMNVENNANFITGDVLTFRNQPSNTLNFLATSFSTGEADISKVDGYASINNLQNFTFPIGDVVQLRPLILNSNATNAVAKCAYFFEDPNTAATFATGFNTNIKSETIGEVSTVEFWHLEGSVPSTISISWNARSNIGALTDDPNNVVAVGWSKAINQWVSLGGTSTGDLTQGFAVSASFVPDDYEIITFSGAGEPSDIINLDNYLVTPNGDGINDVLEFPELALSPNNHMRIFDRYGLKVFDQRNYVNEFGGFANGNSLVLNKDEGLPAGVYFYIISMDDLGLDFQGFLYLASQNAN
ncbi:gliding motility-associated C-terminal domain-containing protein [Aurantibacter crassamenti]|uniref:gliding motility-associated C-terminal domain-containing protein n=1 Tax=Aurantibacter crassamenti TaxID=1837375 RepID=UPI001939B92C|nr:gliding motility-associated C-terminal domain-containing protein [Aurantibacter crassamenti]MBM1108057.1 gliding motility-associated C-terminal domain-containing protein [Aurantibacter crassamenti]